MFGKRQTDEVEETDRRIYPDTVHVPSLPERRYLWTARAFAIAGSVSLAINVILGLAIVQLAPLVRVQPFFVTFAAKSDQVVRIEPIEIPMSAATAISEQMVRNYVLNRHTILGDGQEQALRWGNNSAVRWMSSDQVYSAFVEETQPFYESIKASGMTRSVDILSASKISDNFWQVEFETIDTDPKAAEQQVQRWVATMRIAFHTQRVRYDTRLINPLGFTVVGYSLASKRVRASSQ